VFTAGIGENAAEVRSRACSDLASLGIEIDEKRNRAAQGSRVEIQSEASAVKILVIPTDEELEIAQETIETIGLAGTTTSPGP